MQLGSESCLPVSKARLPQFFHTTFFWHYKVWSFQKCCDLFLLSHWRLEECLCGWGFIFCCEGGSSICFPLFADWLKESEGILRYKCKVELKAPVAVAEDPVSIPRAMWRLTANQLLLLSQGIWSILTFAGTRHAHNTHIFMKTKYSYMQNNK